MGGVLGNRSRIAAVSGDLDNGQAPSGPDAIVLKSMDSGKLTGTSDRRSRTTSKSKHSEDGSGSSGSGSSKSVRNESDDGSDSLTPEVTLIENNFSTKEGILTDQTCQNGEGITGGSCSTSQNGDSITSGSCSTSHGISSQNDNGHPDVSGQEIVTQPVATERPPMPWTEKALEYEEFVMGKFTELRAAYLGGNLRRSSVPILGQPVQGKQQSLEAELFDQQFYREDVPLFARLTEAERSAAAAVSELIPPPPFDLGVSLEWKRKQARGPGIESVRIGDQFGVPKSGLTMIGSLDAMNWLLADVYGSISCTLTRLQTCAVYLELGLGTLEEGENEVMDLRGNLNILRGTGRKLRNAILEIEGLPLKEPTAFWKEKFHMVKF